MQVDQKMNSLEAVKIFEIKIIIFNNIVQHISTLIQTKHAMMQLIEV